MEDTSLSSVGGNANAACSFLSKDVANKYNLDVPEYKGVDQIVELPAEL